MSQNVQVNVVDEITQVDVNQQVVESPYKLPVATKDSLGGIKAGKNVDIQPDGTLNVTKNPTKTSELINDTNFVTEQFVNEKLGDIQTALTNIIALQNSYIGGGNQ